LHATADSEELPIDGGLDGISSEKYTLTISVGPNIVYRPHAKSLASVAKLDRHPLQGKPDIGLEMKARHLLLRSYSPLVSFNNKIHPAI